MNLKSKTLSALLQIAIFLGLMALLAAAIHFLPQKGPMSQGPAPYPALEGTEPIEKKAYPPPEETDGPVIPPTLFPDVTVQPEGVDLWEPTPPIPTWTPFPTPELPKDPTQTAIPLDTPAENASGEISYLEFDSGGLSISLLLLQEEGGNLITSDQRVLPVISERSQSTSIEFHNRAEAIPSPDHKKILLSDIYPEDYQILDLLEGKFLRFAPTLIIENILGWYPDNQHVLIVHGSSQLFLLDPPTGEAVRLVNEQYGQITSAVSSPDGHRIAYVHSLVNSPDGDFFRIWTVDQWGRDAYLLVEEISYPQNLSWSPDGKKIAYWSQTWNIMDVDSSNKSAIKDGSFYPGAFADADWYPDSRYLLVSANTPGLLQEKVKEDQVPEEVYLIDAEKLSATPLLPDRYIYDPSWSPDGKYIIFATFEDGVYEVRITNVQGTYEQSIAIGSTLIRHPMWINP